MPGLEYCISVFSSLPPWLSVFILSMLPIAELRVSLPLALTVYKMPLWEAYVVAVAGNIVPAVCILFLLGPVSRFLMQHSSTARKFFDWLFERTRGRFSKKYMKYGEWALVLLVAIPLPVTGAWTGSVAAFLFGIPVRRSLPLISLGVAIAGIIVGMASSGAISFFH